MAFKRLNKTKNIVKKKKRKVDLTPDFYYDKNNVTANSIATIPYHNFVVEYPTVSPKMEHHRCN